MTPYNLSPKTVKRWENELKQLLTGESVTFRTREPHKLAYRLREAIASAKRHQIEPYNKIDYIFKQTDGLVIAEPRGEDLVKATQLTEARFPDAVSEYDVITAASHAPEAVLVFPNFSGESSSVQNWARAKGYTLEEDPLVLRKKPL